MKRTDVATVTAGAQGITLVRRVVVINLALVALQAVSAGFFLSGYAHALNVHAIGAIGLQVGAVIQAVAALVLWRRRRVPTWVAVVSVGLLVMAFLQVGLGYRRAYWLHVPIGVGLFGALTRQANRLETLARTTIDSVVTT